VTGKKKFVDTNTKRLMNPHTKRVVETVLLFFFLALMLTVYLTFVISGFDGMIQALTYGLGDTRTIIAATLAISVGAIIAISHHHRTRFDLKT
jgi:hypothetical protein